MCILSLDLVKYLGNDFLLIVDNLVRMIYVVQVPWGKFDMCDIVIYK